MIGGEAKVLIQEKDLSTKVPLFPGVYGTLLIPGAKKGPLEPFLCSSESAFLKKFTPDGRVEVGYDSSYYDALNFFQGSNKLWVRRVVNSALYGGVDIYSLSSGTVNSAVSEGYEDPTSHTMETGEAFLLYQKDPGLWGNDLRIRILNYREEELIDCSTDVAANVITVNQRWESGEAVTIFPIDNGSLPAPLTLGTYYVINLSPTTISLALTRDLAISGTALDLTDTGGGEFSMVPVESSGRSGAFKIEVYKSANLNIPVESWLVSRNESDLDGYGNNMYIENVLEGSEYIRAFDNPLVDESEVVSSQVEPLAFDKGSDGSAVTDSDMLVALDDFKNKDNITTTLIMDGGWATVAYQKQGIISLCEYRKDCVGILCTPISAEMSSNYLNEIARYRNSILNANTSYASLYAGHIKIQDKFNDRKIYISPTGYVGSIISKTASNEEIWYPPAGWKRGQINALDVYRRFESGERDFLYENGINPIRFQNGKGITVWGQKTLQSLPSALDRLNVRLMLIVIEPAIAAALDNFLFDLNTPSTRAIVSNLVENYMQWIKSRKGVYSFYVVCDATNNSGEDISNHIMNLDLYVKPTESIEYIQFTTIITKNNLDFKLAQEAV